MAQMRRWIAQPPRCATAFAGNKKFTGTGGGPALNCDNDPSFLELIDTVR